MKKMIYGITGILVCLVLFTVWFSTKAAMDDSGLQSGFLLSDKEIAKGNLTETVTWRVTENEQGEHTLVIGGQGPMDDFADQNQQPWKEWNKTITAMVVEDGVTGIGKNAFKGMYFKEARIGKGVEYISSYAFASGYNLEHITIPGNVKLIDSNAFWFHYALYSITLEEGIEEIRHFAFGTSASKGSRIHIPASLTKIADLVFCPVSSYTVALDNPSYTAVDGVLYNKEKTALVDYPKYSNRAEYRVPEHVCEILPGALQRVITTKRFYIPSTVQSLPERDLTHWSEMEEVYIEDGVPASAYRTFYGCAKLRKFRLPENMPIEKMEDIVQYGCNALESIKIPNGVQQIKSIGWPLKSLQEIIYDAKDAVISDKQLIDKDIIYSLTIGEHVDHISANLYRLSNQADRIIFEKDNQFTIEEGAFRSVTGPVGRLSGSCYVDESGILYSYSAQNGTAEVVLVQKGNKNVFLPEKIEPEEGVVCQVTGIGQDAFSEAEGTESVVFENLSNLQYVCAYGFAGCNTLNSMEGYNTVEKIEELFASCGISLGYRALYKTGLLSELPSEDEREESKSLKELSVPGQSGTSLTIAAKSEAGTLEWTEDENGAGYTMLTGDTLTILAAAGNQQGEENFRYRVYFQWSDKNCSLSVKPGENYLFQDHEVKCSSTEDPNSLYMEFHPKIGKTVSIPVTALYPSPSTAGGMLNVWAVLLSEEEADLTEGRLLDSQTGRMKVWWLTKRDEFTLTTKHTNGAELTLKGTESGIVTTGGNLGWQNLVQRKNQNTMAYGQDYVKSVSYKNKITFPKGIDWREEVLLAIKEGDFYRSGNTWYHGDIPVFQVNVSGGQLTLSGVDLTWDETEESAILSYLVTNQSLTAQMNTNTVSCVIYADALKADTSVFNEKAENQILNEVEALVRYRHSQPALLSSSIYKTIRMGKGSLRLSNVIVKKPLYFGEEMDYVLTLQNPGALSYEASEAESWYLEDILSPYTYMDGKDMERVFSESGDIPLVITMKNVELVPWEEQAGLYPHTSYWKNGYNSGVNEAERALDKVEICRNNAGGEYYVTVREQCFEGRDLTDLLRQAGITAGRWTEYILSWTLCKEGENFLLNPGETRIFPVYTKVKDTFRMLSEDWIESYPTDTALQLANNAQVVTEQGVFKAKTGSNHSVKREAYVLKQAVRANRPLQKDFQIEDGECLTYGVQFLHYGKGGYENLPIVDEMYGAQALLVPAGENPELEKRGLSKYEKDGHNYYVLTEGTYENVVLGSYDQEQAYVAAFITVEKTNGPETVTDHDKTYTYTGLKTRIQWNCHLLPKGSYTMNLCYDAIVRREFSEGNAYTVGNRVYINDKEKSRIYASIWGGGSIIDFSKEILLEKGKTYEKDRIVEGGYSILNAGEKVTYRLILRNKGNGTCTVKGSDFYDELPSNGGVFQWISGENVQISYESTHESTQVRNPEHWTITQHVGEKEKKGIQYIKWEEDTTIIFREAGARFIFYVTLTYPDLTEEGCFNAYRDSIKGNILTNTFFVYEFPVNVSHHLREPGNILFQKGVYGTSYEKGSQFIETRNRLYYNNKDSRERQVIYYLVLYNQGNKRWYLDEVYDCLPEGFSFRKLIPDRNLNAGKDTDKIVTKDAFDNDNLIKDRQNLMNPEEIIYKNATVRYRETETGMICFEFGKAEGNQPIHYDDDRQACYLEQGEALVFGYLCNTGMAENTEDYAQNTAFMHYTDYPRTGVALTDENIITFSAAVDGNHPDQNDGTTLLVKGKDIKEEYGILDGGLSDDFIVSDVLISRGQIIPGITKYTESYVPAGGTKTVEYVNAAGPYDTINWKLRLHNSGTLSITDYRVEDILPAPYVFSGKIHYRICDSFGNEMQSYELLQITERTTDKITFRNNNSTKTISPNGEVTEIYFNSNTKGSFSIKKTEEGREAFSIHFSNYALSIPEGGYVDVTFSSYNPTNEYKNTVYTNQAVLIPNSQAFYSVSQGSMVKDEKGLPFAVKNTSPVTVSFGFATGSEKAVFLKENPNTKAISGKESENIIFLHGKDDIFRYELTVTNDTEKAMEKLIFIDGLPEPGDHSPFDKEAGRGSEFSVNFLEDPHVEVKVTTEDGETVLLSKEEYKVSYSEKNEFDEEDFNGNKVWSAEPEDARALRIIIEDGTGKKLPPKAAVTVSFDCTAKDHPEPGAVSWNSFGYHYKLMDLVPELEAMPLPVGVRMAYVPVLLKEVKDMNGRPHKVLCDTVFSFLVIEGEYSKKEGDSLEDLRKEMEETDRQYHIFDVVVKKGESRSQIISLKDMDWKEGSVYTIFELEGENPYGFQSFNGKDQLSYTFLYQPEQEEIIQCVNTYLEWETLITKVDKEDEKKTLPGAVFAIYGEKEGAWNPDWNRYEVERKIERDGTTWHLLDVGVTDEEGNLTFRKLREKKYYLTEVKAPDGYNKEKEGRVIYWRNAVDGILSLQVANAPGTTLPATGGRGIAGIIAAGILCLTASFGYAYKKKRKEKKI